MASGATVLATLGASWSALAAMAGLAGDWRAALIVGALAVNAIVGAILIVLIAFGHRREIRKLAKVERLLERAIASGAVMPVVTRHAPFAYAEAA